MTTGCGTGRSRRRHVRAGQKGGPEIGSTRCGKGVKPLIAVRAEDRPPATLSAPANRAENRLVEPLLSGTPDESLPEVLLADRAYDDDRLRGHLAGRGTSLVSPHRRGRKRPPRHDGRHLRRYRRRGVVERTIARSHASRRLPTRHEYYPFIYDGFVSLACLILTARAL